MLHIGEKLKELREQKALTQAKLAEALKTTQASIARWESNVHSMNIEDLVSYSKYFDVSTDYILGLKDYE